jgi:hypothetical protein
MSHCETLIHTDEFQEARDNLKITVFENIAFPRLTDEELQYAFNNTQQSRGEKDGTYVVCDAQNLCTTLIENLERLDPPINTFHLFFSTNNSDGFGRHRDMGDVLFVQLKGKTHWKVENHRTGITVETTLSPYDAIYVPRGMYHTVTNATHSRVGLSMGMKPQ